MTYIKIKKSNNFLIKFRALKILIDENFIDYMETKEKRIEIKPNQKELRLKIDWCFSNIYNLEYDDKGNLKNDTFIVTSQIQNGLYIFIYFCFFLSNILMVLKLIGPYWYLSLLSPMLLIIGWQTFGRNNFLRLSTDTTQDKKLG